MIPLWSNDKLIQVFPNSLRFILLSKLCFMQLTTTQTFEKHAFPCALSLSAYNVWLKRRDESQDPKEWKTLQGRALCLLLVVICKRREFLVYRNYHCQKFLRERSFFSWGKVESAPGNQSLIMGISLYLSSFLILLHRLGKALHILKFMYLPSHFNNLCLYLWLTCHNLHKDPVISLDLAK